MARGSENQPEEHVDSIGDCQCVLYEQDSHRGVSKRNKKGFAGGEAGPHWQSHHLLCIMALANRETESPEHAEYLELCLWMTNWNINEKPNMIGLPTRAWYRQEYDAGNFTPQDLPSHNNDHGAFLEEVHEYLTNEVWAYLDPSEKDHAKGAKQLEQALKDASGYFQEQLVDVRGTRNEGTVSSWKTRFDNNTDKAARRKSGGTNNLWYEPFSMAIAPKPRSPGQSHKDLTWLFSSDYWK